MKSGCNYETKALDAAARQGKSHHYLSTDFISAQQAKEAKQRSFSSKDGSQRGSRESLDSFGGDSTVNQSGDSSLIIGSNYVQRTPISGVKSSESTGSINRHGLKSKFFQVLGLQTSGSSPSSPSSS